MNGQNFFHKIPVKKTYTEKIDNNIKYSSRIKPHNHRTINTNFNSLDYDTSDCNSLNIINYSAYNDYNHTKFKNKSNHKLTYVLTTNESSNYIDKNNISQKQNKRSDFFKNFQDYERFRLNTEESRPKNYEKKYLECFQLYTQNNQAKRAFSNKLKQHRENLNKIVKLINEANNLEKKEYDTTEGNNDKNKNEVKENINLSEDLKYNKDQFFLDNVKSQKCLSRGQNINKYRKIGTKFDSHTYNNNRTKYNSINNLEETKRNKNNLLNRKIDHRLMTSDNLNNKAYNNNLKNKYFITDSNNIQSPEINDGDNNNRFLSQVEENNNKINTLRNEFNEISNNYMQISKQIDSLKGKEISYEDILKNNSKTKDLLNYNYKNNNDEDNEKVLVLMKLKLKNDEIIFKKLEDENKICKKKYKKYNHILKKNNGLKEENNSLKEELNDMNINYQKLNDELQHYENKFSNINAFNKKIQEINRGLIAENSELKRKLELSKKECKELKNNYDKLIPQQNEIMKKIEDEKNHTLKEIEEKYIYIDEENKNLKILLDNSQSKCKILEEFSTELNGKYLKIEDNLKNINNKNNELQNINNRLNEENKILKEKINELENNKNEKEKKLNDIENKYNNLLNEYNIINNKNKNEEKNMIDLKNKINDNQINIKEIENKYNNLLTKYEELSQKYDKIKNENETLKYKLINKENEINQISNEKISNENKKINDIINEKEGLINELNKKSQEYQNKMIEFQEIENKLNSEKNKNNQLNKEKMKLEDNYNNLNKENNKLKSDYDNLQNEFSKFKNSYQSLITIKSKKNEFQNKNKELIISINDLKNDIESKNNEIQRLNAIITKFKISLDDNYDYNNNAQSSDNEIILDKNKIFTQLYKKFFLKILKESKIKMIIGIYLQKQKIYFEKQYKLCNDKNIKLMAINKKLNDKIIEYKLNNLNKNPIIDKNNINEVIKINQNDKTDEIKNENKNVWKRTYKRYYNQRK